MLFDPSIVNWENLVNRSDGSRRNVVNSHERIWTRVIENFYVYTMLRVCVCVCVCVCVLYETFWIYLTFTFLFVNSQSLPRRQQKSECANFVMGLALLLLIKNFPRSRNIFHQWLFYTYVLNFSDFRNDTSDLHFKFYHRIYMRFRDVSNYNTHSQKVALRTFKYARWECIVHQVLA